MAKRQQARRPVETAGERIRLGPLRRVDFDAGEGPGGLGADDRI